MAAPNASRASAAVTPIGRASSPRSPRRADLRRWRGPGGRAPLIILAGSSRRAALLVGKLAAPARLAHPQHDSADRHVEDWREEQAEERDADHAEEHGSPERLAHLGAGAGRGHERD